MKKMLMCAVYLLLGGCAGFTYKPHNLPRSEYRLEYLQPCCCERNRPAYNKDLNDQSR